MSKLIQPTEPKKHGRKTVFDSSLSDSELDTFRYPPEIHSLYREEEVKKLLNRMAIDPEFKADILGRISKKVRKKKS